MTQNDLDRSFVRGVFWTGSVRWVAQAVAWVSTLFVARLLSPADSGVMGMTAWFVGMLQLISEFGVGTAIVASKTLTEEQTRQLHALSPIIGIGSFVTTCILAYPIALFFRTPQLAWVMIALGITFPIVCVRVVPQALLRRELQFRRLAIIDGTQSLVVAATALILAFLGARYWALVWSTILGAVVSTVITSLVRPVGFQRPKAQSLRDLISYSKHVMVASIAWSLYEDSDFIVAGRRLGQAALGAYSFAWNIAFLPVQKISTLVTSVTPGVFAASHNDAGGLRRYVLRTLEVLSLIILPATIGLSIVAADMVPLVFGEKWRPMSPVLQVLAAYAGVRGLLPVLSQALIIAGDARYTMMRNLTAAVCLPVAFVIGSKWGPTGIAMAWVIAHPVVILGPIVSRVSSRLEISGRELMRSLAPVSIACLVMVGACLAAGAALHQGGFSAGFVFGGKIVVGVIAYVSTLLLTYGERLRAVVSLLPWLRGAGGSRQ